MYIPKVIKMSHQQKRVKITNQKIYAMSILIWLQEWFKSQCDGDWEHSYGIKLESLDNPGWSVTIETENSNSELNDFDWISNEVNDTDWHYYRVINGAYEASGDFNKLEKLITIFKNLIERPSDVEV